MKTQFIIATLLLIPLASAICQDTTPEALLITGSEEYIPTHSNLERVLTNNKYHTTTTRTHEDFIKTVDTLSSTTNCNTNILIDIATDATSIWKTRIQHWNSTNIDERETQGKPYSAVQNKDYSTCTTNPQQPHCNDLTNHHRDIPPGYRIISAELTDWCIIINNKCIRTQELNRLIGKIPSCNKKIILATSDAGMAIDLLPGPEIYTTSEETAHPSTHKYLINQLSNKFDLLEAFAQTKAFATGKNPLLRFANRPCKCTCPQEPENKQQEQPKPTTIQPAQVPEKKTENVQPPTPLPKPTPPIHPQLSKPPLPKLSITIAPTPTTHELSQNTDCIKECTHLNIPAGMTAQQLEIIPASTLAECKQKTSFETHIPKQPCTDYFIATRTVFTTAQEKNILKCCCKKIATLPTKRCTAQTFLGWTNTGIGVIKGKNHEVAYTQ